MLEKAFPSALIVLDIAAALVYLLKSWDLRMFTYWMAAAILTACVTFR